MQSIHKSEFNFDLKDEQIAKFPLEQRDASKLLIYKDGGITHARFNRISDYLKAADCLVFNNAKVIPARLYFKRETGALIEVLLLEPIEPKSYDLVFSSEHSCQWKCIIGNLKKWKDNEVIYFSDSSCSLTAELIDRENKIVALKWEGGKAFSDLLDSIGELPLPPYLNRDTETSDYQTYQTVFAAKQGSVAAPTAGLHFTDIVLGGITEKGIDKIDLTLHVGAGTFLPVKADNVLDHAMHREYFEVELMALENLISKKNRVCVGTTSLRVLESLYWMGVRFAKSDFTLLTQKLEPYEVESELSYEESLAFIVAYLKENNLEKLQASTEILYPKGYKKN